MKPIKDSNRKGDFAEYYAVTWLWDNGFEVFQNSGCTGPIDMIAVDKKGMATYIDVKTIHVGPKTEPHRGCKKTRTKIQKKLGVKILGFNPDTRELHFIGHKDNE